MSRIGRWKLAAAAALLLAAVVLCGRAESQAAGGPAATQPAATQPAAGRTDLPADWAKNWPQFRGPADGHAIGAAPLLPVDLAKDVRFKVAVPAAGNSSPIVWGDRVYLTGEGDRIMAFDRKTGKLLWNTALTSPEPVAMPGDDQLQADPNTGAAAPTPCTDGKRVYAFFGTGVLGCVDLDGKQLWSQRMTPGKPRNFFGLAASPVLYGETVIQVVDMGKEPEDGQSFITAVRATDGAEVWRKDREVRSSWSTPAIVRVGGRDLLLTAAAPLVVAYDPKTGAELWSAGELTGDVTATPILCGNLIIALSGEGGPMFAFRPDGKGDVSKSHLAWKKKAPLPDVPNPLCDGKHYFHIAVNGDLMCLNPADGSEVWTKDVPGQVWASPILVGGRICLINAEGEMFVMATADGKSLAEGEGGKARPVAKFADKVITTPAVLDGQMFVRTEKELICVGRQ